MELRTIKFHVPSGHEFEIREQNGEDEDILSNPREMRTLLHLSRFIAAITVRSTYTASGKLTMKDALNLPLLDRYCILLQSRIFSLGETLEFDYQWAPNRSVKYEEDLTNYLFEDYSQAPSEEEMEAKPYAIPLYPDPSIIDGKEFTLSSGKKIFWQAANGNTEQTILKLSDEKRTRNAELMARNLMLDVDGKFEKVQNFTLFSVRDMAEIRKLVNTYDPAFQGISDIEDPETGQTAQYPILAAPGFFFLTEL